MNSSNTDMMIEINRFSGDFPFIVKTEKPKGNEKHGLLGLQLLIALRWYLNGTCWGPSVWFRLFFPGEEVDKPHKCRRIRPLVDSWNYHSLHRKRRRSGGSGKSLPFTVTGGRREEKRGKRGQRGLPSTPEHLVMEWQRRLKANPSHSDSSPICSSRHFFETLKVLVKSASLLSKTLLNAQEPAVWIF